MNDQTTTTAPQGTYASVSARFHALIGEIEAIPGEITEELTIAKTRIGQAIQRIEAHFASVKDSADVEVATVESDVKSDASKIEGEAQAAAAEVKTEAASVEAKLDTPATSTDAAAATAATAASAG
jgi:hypothetical protein